jgi:hypothetical protein
MPKVKLTGPQSYTVEGHKFEKGVEQEVSPELAEQLREHDEFEVSETPDEGDEPDEHDEHEGDEGDEPDEHDETNPSQPPGDKADKQAAKGKKKPGITIHKASPAASQDHRLDAAGGRAEHKGPDQAMSKKAVDRDDAPDGGEEPSVPV